MTEAHDRRPAGIAPTTILQKFVHPALAELHLGNVIVPGRFEAHRVAGFVSRMKDLPSGTAGELAEAYGLDKIPGWPVGGPVYVLRFRAGTEMLYTTSFGGQNAEGAQRMNSPVIYPAPFVGTGYTPSSEHTIPEYFMELTEIAAGTEMWRIDADGTSLRVGKYVHRQLGWVRTGSPSFGPATWWRGPISLRPTVRRGLTARYRGLDFDADFGPDTGQVTLHPMPGTPAPPDFTEREGTRSLVVLDAQTDELTYRRQLCAWRGAAFELVDLGPQEAVVHFLGQNYEVAEQLGLTEVDYRIWRTIVPRSELTDVRPEVRPVRRGVLTA
ncbi:hypothetical protein CFN78_23390 [Amycolatopsis antarctica]|uniref:Uncharacterized protein n=1 Tax=Amycolatopsis antarctica TaxID=1854586 RepID=A0A263CZY6_9PSEU|nr:hypothetical protein [Amycolatopsis antarctica]OZM70856.1 hypothetical protein CFN78_23390 [Amycolatopsis antarctica]